MLGVRSMLVFAVVLIVCNQSTAGKHNEKLTEKELKTLEEIERLLEERKRENGLQKSEDAKLLVKEAFGTCIEEFNRFRESQRQFKMQGKSNLRNTCKKTKGIRYRTNDGAKRDGLYPLSKIHCTDNSLLFLPSCIVF